MMILTNRINAEEVSEPPIGGRQGYVKIEVVHLWFIACFIIDTFAQY